MPTDDATVLDIVQACRRVARFRGPQSKSEFLEDGKTQSAVLHQLAIIGEAVKRLSTDFRQGHADMPWREMAGMRDLLIHHYDHVDLDEIWKTISDDVPSLLAYLEPLLPQR